MPGAVDVGEPDGLRVRVGGRDIRLDRLRDDEHGTAGVDTLELMKTHVGMVEGFATGASSVALFARDSAVPISRASAAFGSAASSAVGFAAASFAASQPPVKPARNRPLRMCAFFFITFQTKSLR